MQDISEDKILLGILTNKTQWFIGDSLKYVSRLQTHAPGRTTSSRQNDACLHVVLPGTWWYVELYSTQTCLMSICHIKYETLPHPWDQFKIFQTYVACWGSSYLSGCWTLNTLAEVSPDAVTIVLPSLQKKKDTSIIKSQIYYMSK